MPDASRLRLAGLLAGFVFAMAFVSMAQADGEVGLVVQNGDQVTTYCVAFKGDGITGQDLLKNVGISVEAFGGGSGLAVCALGATGCQDASSFTSCFCQCQGGDCMYWAFFTRQYGKNWVYSSLAFNLLKAKDGDVHGWKWGKGAANSAPAPQDITFNQICGHDPRGGIAPSPTLAATNTPLAPTLVAPTSNSPAASSQTPGTEEPVVSESPSVTSSAAAPTVTVTLGEKVATAAPTSAPRLAPATGSSDDGSSRTAYLAFGGIAAALLVLIATAVLARRRRGN
ncbi:MAG: hypothetical protein ABI577_06025 [bacterium]